MYEKRVGRFIKEFEWYIEVFRNLHNHKVKKQF